MAQRTALFTDDEWAELARLRERSRAAALLTAFSGFESEYGPQSPTVGRVLFLTWLRGRRGRLSEFGRVALEWDWSGIGPVELGLKAAEAA